MGAKENIELQNRIYAHFSENRFEEAIRLSSEEIVIEMIALGQIHKGHAGFRDFMQSFKGAFPDLRIQLRSQLADETRVAAEIVGVATHTGPLQTPNGKIPATGRKVTFTACEVWDIQAGLLVGLRNYQDMGSVLRQLGVM